jgi:16S rRNA processing protein RimM
MLLQKPLPPPPRKKHQPKKLQPKKLQPKKHQPKKLQPKKLQPKKHQPKKRLPKKLPPKKRLLKKLLLRKKRKTSLNGIVPENDDSLVRLGVITGAHGVRGAVKVKTFTQDPQDLSAYGTLTSEDGTQSFEITRLAQDKAGLRVTFKDIHHRDQAEALKGLVLCVARDALPDLQDEEDFYHADLIGLHAKSPDGAPLGVVEGVHNFGAGDVLEIAGEMIAFTKHTVPEIDLAGQTITVVMPAEVEARPPEQESSGQPKPNRRQRARANRKKARAAREKDDEQ